MKKGEYDETPFGLITQSDILTSEDIASIEPLKQELKDTFIKVQMFRTRAEMEVSVLDEISFPTPSSRYWQAVREQNVMFQELVMLSYEYRKNIVEIKIKKREEEQESDSLKKELIHIEIEKKTFEARGMERMAKARIMEIKHWSDIKNRESKEMSAEQLSDVGNHQLISYTKRWLMQARAMGGNGSPAERQNLFGQLRSGIHACIDAGILNEVLEGMDDEYTRTVKTDYNLGEDLRPKK